MISQRRPVLGAVITVFNPTSDLLTTLRSTVGQVDLVVVVNDSPQLASADRGVLRELGELGVRVVDHPANLGIAAALNTGIETLRAELPDFEAVLTCDQDSSLPAGYVEALVDTERRAREAGVPVGMVAPSAAGNIMKLPGTSGGGDLQVGGEPIQSGLLIGRGTLDAVGGFDESLFIDGVDSDFYLRTLDAGLVPVIAPVAIEHQLGQTRVVRLGPARLALTVASDYRYYYRVRNLIMVGRSHFRRHPGWVIRAFAKELRHQVITGLLVSGRFGRWSMGWRGLVAGLRRRSGRMPS